MRQMTRELTQEETTRKAISLFLKIKFAVKTFPQRKSQVQVNSLLNSIANLRNK